MCDLPAGRHVPLQACPNELEAGYQERGNLAMRHALAELHTLLERASATEAEAAVETGEEVVRQAITTNAISR